MKQSQPTDEQIATAQKIAEKLGRTIPEQALNSELVMKMWTKSVIGLLTEKEQLGVSVGKRNEQILTAITWYQKESSCEKITCPVDGKLLEGVHFYGNVSLECPICNYRLRQIPQHIIKLFKEAHHADKPTSKR